MNKSANPTANSVNSPTIESRKTFTVIGAIKASMPSTMHASTTTEPSKSPIAISACLLRTLCSEKVNSGSVVPKATSTSPIMKLGTPICVASECVLVNT